MRAGRASAHAFGHASDGIPAGKCAGGCAPQSRWGHALAVVRTIGGLGGERARGGLVAAFPEHSSGDGLPGPRRRAWWRSPPRSLERSVRGVRGERGLGDVAAGGGAGGRGQATFGLDPSHLHALSAGAGAMRIRSRAVARGPTRERGRPSMGHRSVAAFGSVRCRRRLPGRSAGSTAAATSARGAGRTHARTLLPTCGHHDPAITGCRAPLRRTGSLARHAHASRAFRRVAMPRHAPHPVRFSGVVP